MTKALCLIGAMPSSPPADATEVPGLGRLMNLKYQCSPILLILFTSTMEFLTMIQTVLISDLKVQALLNCRPQGISVDGLGTGLAAYNRFEVVAGSNHYIANSDLSSCDPYTWIIIQLILVHRY